MKLIQLHRLSEESHNEVELLLLLLEEVGFPGLIRTINSTPEKEKVVGWAIDLFRQVRADREIDDLLAGVNALSNISGSLIKLSSTVSGREREGLRRLSRIGDEVELAMRAANPPFGSVFSTQLDTLEVLISNLQVLRSAALDPGAEQDYGFKNELQPALVRSTFKKLGFI